MSTSSSIAVSESPVISEWKRHSLTDCSSDKAAVQARLRLSAETCFIELCSWRIGGGLEGIRVTLSESPSLESRGLETRSRERREI